MAVRKIDRNVSVSTTASMAKTTAGRKAMALWLPLRAICAVRRSASSRRTEDESSTLTARSLKALLS